MMQIRPVSSSPLLLRQYFLTAALCAVAASLSGCGGGSSIGSGGGGNTVQTATPSFSPAPGTFSSTQSVTISDSTAGATIYYTTDGSTPTTSSTKYTAAVSVAATTTLEAIATASGDTQSATASGVYTITAPTVATPTFSPAPGSYTTAQSVTISDATSGATIYYTTDGTTPTTSSTKYTSAINIASTTTLEAIATATGDTQSATASAVYTIGPAGIPVNVYLTTHDQTNLLAPQTAVSFSTAAAASNQILVDEAQQYQTMEGFGAAFTDSACYLLEQVAQPTQLTSTLNDLFTRNGNNGIGLSFMRDPMGASDIARSVYSFDDVATGATDIPLANFSIAHDQTYILPLITAAKTLNPQMKLMSNPWSPPAWMKNTDSMLGGSLNTADYTAFANYFVKYLQAYQAAGVTVDYITLQNEPLNNTNQYPSMLMDAPTQLTVLRDYVLPALTAANLTTKVFVYDHNWDTPSYPTTVLSDPTILASSQVAGTAWHGYDGPEGAQQGVQNQFPTKGTWETEHSGGTFTTDQFTTDFLEITLVLRNAAKSFVKWSLALDQTLGPNLGELNQGYGGCTTCTPLVTVNNSTGNITKDIEFYTLGQYSKWVLPGAVRVWSSDSPTIVSAAFVNPDGTRALIAYNNSTSSSAFQVVWGTQSFSYTLPALGAATFTWSGTQTGTPTIPATQQIQGASYSSQSGLETEETGDTTGSYDLGYIVTGAYAVYNNVNFGTGVSQVNVRAASDGGGGTVSFYLDSMSGTPIATLAVTPTGGWQTWTTVNAPVTGATGTHTLYAVFTSTATNGIFNINWFQFQ
jgi:glucosylceramidase